MTDAIELKPCPCGAQAHASETIGGWMINCCPPQCGFEAVRDTREDAALAWNTRPVEDALRARIAELEAAAKEREAVMSGAIAVSKRWAFDVAAEKLIEIAQSSKPLGLAEAADVVRDLWLVGKDVR